MAKAKTSKSAKIREALTATPDKTVVEIAKEVGVKPGLVYNVKANMKKKAGKAKGKPGRKPGKKSATKVVVAHAAHDALGTAIEFVIKVGGLTPRRKTAQHVEGDQRTVVRFPGWAKRLPKSTDFFYPHGQRPAQCCLVAQPAARLGSETARLFLGLLADPRVSRIAAPGRPAG